MISILRILVFILVQGHVVCDRELYPVSMFRMDIDENQPIDLPENGETKPPRGKSDGERRAVAPAVNVDEITPENLRDGIANAYGFEKDPNDYRWKTLPSFEGKIGKPGWADAAKLAEDFFRANNGHNTPWKNLLDTKSELDLLYITAARYLFVTHVLWVQSNRQLIACKEKRDKYSGIIQSFEIPTTGVCFPLPYGSATYKSDYDVGLIGVNSGTLTQSFNQYFQAAAPNGFGKPSELVFDTNVYAFTLEFAMPAMFTSLPPLFTFGLHKLEQTKWYKMQELASAYYKVFKYNEDFFEEMKKEATDKIEDKMAKKILHFWLRTFEDMNKQVPLQQKNTPLAAFRLAHNKKYQEYLQSMSQGETGGYQRESTEHLAKALLYAAEAYHTRGAIRHVVQGLQMNAIPTCQYYTPLSTYDLWVSMIENWGEANKECKHCKLISVVDCLMKMSKYLSRMFDAMRVIRSSRLPKKDREGLLDFGTTDDPEFVTDLLLRYRRSGKKLSPADKQFVERLLKKFECDLNSDLRDFQSNCLKNIQIKVNAYNKKLAAKVNKIVGMRFFEPPPNRF